MVNPAAYNELHDLAKSAHAEYERIDSRILSDDDDLRHCPRWIPFASLLPKLLPLFLSYYGGYYPYYGFSRGFLIRHGGGHHAKHFGHGHGGGHRGKHFSHGHSVGHHGDGGHH